MKKKFYLLTISVLLACPAYAQTDVAAASPAGPLGGGSWLRFGTGGITDIQESWGLNLIGDSNHPVKFYNSSVLVGYMTSGGNVGTGNLMVSGNLGLGTLTPGEKLEVNGNVVLSGSGWYRAGVNNWFGAANALSAGNATISDLGIRTDGNLIFMKGGGVETARFTSDGNLGIGTTNPTAALDVNGGIAIAGAVVSSSQNIPVAADGTYVIASGSRIKGTYTLSFEGSNRVQTVELLVSACQFDGNSTLSILTNNPYGGNAVMSDFRLMFSPDLSTVYLVMTVGNRNGGANVTAHFDGTGAYNPGWGGTLPNSPVLAGLYPLSVNMATVGIGTTDTKGYTFAVNGKAIATSMTVKAYANWPDYVFAPAFRLKPLTEVASYIDQHHHLPDMPSASEVEKNGLNLGEINQQLTKKVEELTLYLIEKDKQLSEQKQINQAQETRLDAIEKQLKINNPTAKP